MPRYFFNVIGRTVEMDGEGTELQSAAHAKQEATALMGALVSEGLLARHNGRLRLEVADEAGIALFHFNMTSWEASSGLST